MSLLEQWRSRLADIQERLDKFTSDDELQSEDAEDGWKFFLSIFKDTCAVVREAEKAQETHLEEIVSSSGDILNEAICFAYGDADVYDFIPSFAHTDDGESPLLEGGKKGSMFGAGLLESLMPILQLFIDTGGPGQASAPRSVEDMLQRAPELRGAEPYDASMKPHPKSTPLARFRKDIPTLTVSSMPPSLISNIIYQARCEVTSEPICLPVRLSISQAGSCVALAAMGGWKNRTPVLNYYLSRDTTEDDEIPGGRHVELGLSHLAYHIATDEDRKLMFVADSDRIKSYDWEQEALPTHTLQSGSYSGAMAMLPGGRLVRAGKGKVGVWNIDQLAIHGPKGTNRIGKKISREGSWRDEDDEIELSSGSAPHGFITFASSPDIRSNMWHALTHSTNPASVLSASLSNGRTGDYSCLTLDLNEGKVLGRYLGHGAQIRDFSTSAADPHAFLTACDDGCSRLFDLRKRLPVMTFDACSQSGFCPSAVLAHPDGVPSAVFTGSDNKEQVAVWDIRARTIVYELATGNNSVTSLAWNDRTSQLYAATECKGIDRMGCHHNYRKAKIPKKGEREHGVDEDVMMDDEDGEDGEDDYDEDDEDDYDDYEGKCWPKKAFHNEDYFEYAFDAGEHRILRYAFKAEPSTDLLPPYGDATVNHDGFW